MPSSYPGTIKVFSTKADNTDVNYAAHVNDLQDEVVAIETILGTNPANSTARATNFASVDARLEDLETDVSYAGHTHSTGSITGLATVATTGSYNDLSNKPTLSSLGGVPLATVTAKGQIYAATASGAVAAHGVGTNGFQIIFDSAQGDGLKNIDTKRTQCITFDGGGSVLTSGTKAYFRIPVDATLVEWTILALDGLTGSITFDIWKDVYANFPPVLADTITASAKPAVAAATKATSTTLTGWTTSVTAGDIFVVNIDSVTTFTKVALFLDYRLR